MLASNLAFLFIVGYNKGKTPNNVKCLRFQNNKTDCLACNRVGYNSGQCPAGVQGDWFNCQRQGPSWDNIVTVPATKLDCGQSWSPPPPPSPPPTTNINLTNILPTPSLYPTFGPYRKTVFLVIFKFCDKCIKAYKINSGCFISTLWYV